MAICFAEVHWQTQALRSIMLQSTLAATVHHNKVQTSTIMDVTLSIVVSIAGHSTQVYIAVCLKMFAVPAYFFFNSV